MDSYRLTLTVHVVSALLLLAALLLNLLGLWQLARARLGWAPLLGVLGHGTGVLALVVLLSGGLLIGRGWGLHSGWIQVSLASLLLLAGLQPLLVSPQLRRLAAGQPLLAAQTRRLWTGALGLTGGTLGILADMLLKPETLWALLVVLLGTGLGLGLAPLAPARIPAARGGAA